MQMHVYNGHAFSFDIDSFPKQPTQIEESNIISNKHIIHNMVKNPNWQEADHLAIDKA